MEQLSQSEKAEAIKSLQSTIHKSQNALAKMTNEGASTTLITKRLKAHAVGLAILKYVWNQQPHHYSQDDIAEAHRTLTDLIPTIETSRAKIKPNSAQRTLLDRRIRALQLAVQALNKL